MEIVKGYKRTEVGLIPEEWKIHKVKDLIDLLTDYDANGSFESVAQNVNVYDHEEYAWYVRSTDLENNSKLDKVRYVDESSYKFLKKTSLNGGELLFLKRGDIGNVYLFEMKTQRATVAPNLYLLKLNQISDSKYLFYYFISNYGQRQLKSKNASSTLGALYKDDVKSILVPLPPTIAEQTAIANALSDIDDLISKTEKLIYKKKAIKQGVMQELLKPKEGWVKRKFTDIVDYIHGKAHEQFIVDDGKFKVVNSKFISSNGEVVKYSNNSFLTAKKNDILTVLSDLPNGKALAKCFLVEKDNLYAVNQRVCIWRSKGADSIFLYYLLNRHKYFLQLDDGVTQTHILNGDINRFELTITEDLETQKEIGVILSDIDKEIVILEKRNDKLNYQKQGMMQALLTGKIRLL
ncbi:MAG: restriction endonuclease subunit S [Bacteroidetes bacterium]|nr:restriction endonuclease subunit S [Bacteroidota bacterium]